MSVNRCTIVIEDSADNLQVHIDGKVEVVDDSEEHRSAALHLYTEVINDLQSYLRQSEHFDADADKASD